MDVIFAVSVPMAILAILVWIYVDVYLHPKNYFKRRNRKKTKK